MLAKQEQRHIYYDRDLKLEAYNLSGIVQKFPNHFHECYVIGFVEGGKRHLWCRGQEYDLTAGDLILFNPRDNHYCEPIGGEILDYRAVNIDVEIMTKAVRDITGKDYIPRFTQNVLYQNDVAQSVGALYDSILNDEPKLRKEENLYYLLEQILQEYAVPFDETEVLEPNQQIKKLCVYMEAHFDESISLDDMVSMTSFGKSYLLRAFTKQTGVSPYRYLQTIRLDRAKKFLEQGIAPIDAAFMAGFSDQSHFTNFFKEFIGLTPKQYQRIFTEPDAPVEANMETNIEMNIE